MPDQVFHAKSGTIHTIGTADYMGNFRSARFTVTQRVFEHSGPMDDFEYVTPTRLGCTLETSAFVLADGTWELEQFLPPTSELVVVSSDLMDGRTLTGTFCITDIGGSVGDEANEQTISARSHGTFEIS